MRPDLALYIAKLRRHDWEFEFSDDGEVWRRGSEERKTLLLAARTLDPDYEIWNNNCPTNHRMVACKTPPPL